MARHQFSHPLTGALLGLVLSLFGLSSGAVADPPAATYSFTILEVPGATETYPASINNSGEVVGSYWDPSDQQHPEHVLIGFIGFVYSNGTFTTLDVPGATGTDPHSINDSGQVTGFYSDGSGTHGFVYSNGAFATLDVPGAIGTFAASINDSSQITGSYSDGSRFYGFVYSNGTFIALDPPGATDAHARSINDSGQVAGDYYDDSRNRGFVYSNGAFATLDVPGATDTYPTSINASGQVTGFCHERLEGIPCNRRGFIAIPMVTDIPTLSQWALLLGGGLLIGMALLAQVRRTRPLRG